MCLHGSSLQNFFMNIPRNWLGFQAQADASQTVNVAQPAATDPRFRAGAILGSLAWLCIVVSLWHSIKHYRPHARTRFLGRLRTVPLHFLLTIPLVLITIGYAEAQSWLWIINVGSDDVNVGWLYGLGYGPPILIMFLNIVAALHYPNEDLELIRQRVARGRAADAELGIDRRSRKPWWWRRVANEIGLDNDAKLRALAGEVGGGPATGARINRQIELRALESQREEEGNQTSAASGEFAGDPRSRPFRDDETEIATMTGSGQSTDSYRDMTSPESPAIQRGVLERGDSMASFGSGTTAVSGLNQAPPQRVRSMLDI